MNNLVRIKKRITSKSIKSSQICEVVIVHGRVKGGLKPNVFVTSVGEASPFEMLVLTGAGLKFLTLKSL